MSKITGRNKRVYLDTDVLVSAQLSSRGAAFWLINKVENLQKFTSNKTKQEFEEVCKRLEVKLDYNVLSDFTEIEDKEQDEELQHEYESYVNDPGDTPALFGAIRSQSEYLLTYNIRDYKIDSIKKAFNIIIMRPGEFLQYLRSLR